MEDSISVDQFIEAVLDLPVDKSFKQRRKFYTTQKEHWLRWLAEYHTPGFYGRTPNENCDAKTVYNGIGEPKMLVYLIEASGTRPDTADEIRKIMATDKHMASKSKEIRKLVPWEDVARKLFG